MTNPLETYFQEKTAAPGQGMLPGAAEWAAKQGPSAGRAFFNATKEVATKGAIGAVGAAGAAGVGVVATKIYDAITKRRDFLAMLENNQDLQEHFDQNPKYFNLAYSSLRSTSPAFGKDPIVAGHYMRRIMDGQADPGGVLMQAMKDSPRDRGSNPIAEAFGSGALDGVKSGLKGMSEAADR